MPMNPVLRVRRRALLASVALLAPATVVFQPAVSRAAPATDSAAAIETVIVTAQKRPENVQDVPSSITAFSGDQLERQNVTSFVDIARMTPSLQVYNSINTRNTTISIRNQGTSANNPGLESDVGLFIDGVYVPALAAALNDLVDISTVEILRGPQGTLYGRNTPVGNVNITTRIPTQKFEAMLSGEIGNYDHHKVTGYIGGGITEDVAARLSLWSDSHAGNIKNLNTNRYVNSSDNWGARARVRWTPDADTIVDFIGYYSKLRYNGFFQAQVDPYGEGGIIGLIGTPQASYGANSTYNFQTAWNTMYPATPYRVPGKFETDDGNTGASGSDKDYGASVNVERTLPFGATLSNLVAFNGVKQYSNTPNSGLPLAVLPLSPSRNKWTSFSDELRIVSPGHQFIDYVAGVDFYHQDLTYTTITRIGAPANLVSGGNTFTPGQFATSTLDESVNDVAAYAQVTANLTDALRLTGGLRKSWDRKHGVGRRFNTEPDGTSCLSPLPAGEPSCALFNAVFGPYAYDTHIRNNPVTWMASVQYDVAEGVMLYATAANGFKEGGFASQVAPLGPEKTQNYEIGMKSILWDGRILLNLDVYRMRINGLQVSGLAPSGTSFIALNAGKIRQNGVEADTEIHPIDPLTINATLSYIDAVYTSFPNATCVTGYPYSGAPIPAGSPQKNTSGPYAGACDQTGFTPNNSPKWKWSLAARWEQPWGSSDYQWFVSGSAHGISKQFLAPVLDPRSLQPGYTLFDASLGIEPIGGGWNVQLYARNIANKGYFLAITSGPGYSLYKIAGVSPAGYVGYWGQPRTFGISASKKF